MAATRPSLDTRSQAEYLGTAAGFGNRLPGLGDPCADPTLEWVELIDPAIKTLKPAAELRVPAGVEGNYSRLRDTTPTDTGGARAALATIVLKILGYQKMLRDLHRAFGQWSRQPDTPVERSQI